jgi:hypothetical protein
MARDPSSGMQCRLCGGAEFIIGILAARVHIRATKSIRTRNLFKVFAILMLLTCMAAYTLVFHLQPILPLHWHSSDDPAGRHLG